MTRKLFTHLIFQQFPNCPKRITTAKPLEVLISAAFSLNKGSPRVFEIITKK